LAAHELELHRVFSPAKQSKNKNIAMPHYRAPPRAGFEISHTGSSLQSGLFDRFTEVEQVAGW
jgi:hypothetical protein